MKETSKRNVFEKRVKRGPSVTERRVISEFKRQKQCEETEQVREIEKEEKTRRSKRRRDKVSEDETK